MEAYDAMLYRRQLLIQAFKLADLLIMAGSFAAVVWLVARRPGRLSPWDLLLFAGLAIVWNQVLTAFGLYRSWRLSSRQAEASQVGKATLLGSLVIFNVASLGEIQMIDLRFIAMFWVSSTAATIGFRLLLRSGLAQLRLRGRNLRYVLVVGTNLRARRFAEKIEARGELGYRLIGFVDEEWVGIGEFRANGGKLVAGFDDLVEFLRGNVVDEVVLALPVGSLYPRGERIIRRCAEQGITVRFLSDILNLRPPRAKVEMFHDHPVLTLQSGALDGWPMLAKQKLDFLLSLVLLSALAPLFLAVAALVKWTSPGPVFFVQERLGLNKRRFRLYKFRTMVEDAEARLAELEKLNEVSGPVFKIKHDPRLTPIGQFLRKTSIDELPQLFNVLKGDMSLVGPRPLPLRDYEGFSEDRHRRRFSVRPGLTCLWQISGRSGIPFERWMELDMQYIDEWSLWLDLEILARTVPAVVRGTGAA